jgi:undecaprenyl diphosphate synthase
MSLLSNIDPQKVPQHVAIIMDGNGRWAQNHGRERVFGHLNGVEAVRAALKAATASGVKYLTLYAFSTENWRRPKEEVEALMTLLVHTIMGELEELDKNEVRLHTIGDIENLPAECRAELQKGKERTAHHHRVNLILALSYSSRWEITTAIKKMISHGITAAEVTDETVSKYLNTDAFPDPELLIRTSGEHRISNFLLWQIAYAELYFTETLWPDFREEDFYAALIDYQGRERRFGRTSAQLTDIEEPNMQADIDQKKDESF